MVVDLDGSEVARVTCRGFERRNHSSGMQKRKLRLAGERNGLAMKDFSMMFETSDKEGSFEISIRDSADYLE
jgi:hypothetical protein